MDAEMPGLSTVELVKRLDMNTLAFVFPGLVWATAPGDVIDVYGALDKRTEGKEPNSIEECVWEAAASVPVRCAYGYVPAQAEAIAYYFRRLRHTLTHGTPQTKAQRRAAHRAGEGR